MRLIGICGKARHGKDTVAQMLSLEAPTTIEAFAVGVKSVAKKLGWNGEKDNNGRVLLQYIGLRERADDPEHWIRMLFGRIEGLSGIVAITDVRFRNEAEAILARGGELWRVVRPGFDNGLTPEQKAHPSETDLDNYFIKREIVNDGTMEELHAKVMAAYKDGKNETS
jgi:hypothetical protein